MKRKVIFSFIIVLMTVSVLPAGLFSLGAEDEPARPVGIQPWKTLENLQILKNFKVAEVEKGTEMSFDMKCIKESLEQAKIAQSVSIMYINSNEMVYHLGTYAPAVQKRKRVQSGKEWVYINPQPEPPGSWSSIPFTKKLAKNAAVKGHLIAPAGKAKLVFKNLMGQVKAVVVLNPQ